MRSFLAQTCLEKRQNWPYHLTSWVFKKKHFLPSRDVIICGLTIAIPIHRSLHASEPWNPQKVSKRSSWASPSGVSKKRRKSTRTLILTPFWLFFGPFGDWFWHFVDTPASEAREDPFETFGEFGARGCGDSCNMGMAIASLTKFAVWSSKGFSTSGAGCGLPRVSHGGCLRWLHYQNDWQRWVESHLCR